MKRKRPSLCAAGSAAALASLGLIAGRALAEPGRAYAIYVNGGAQADLTVRLPPETYQAQWVNTRSGKIDKAEAFAHTGGNRTLKSPVYEQGIALRIVRKMEPEK